MINRSSRQRHSADGHAVAWCAELASGHAVGGLNRAERHWQNSRERGRRATAALLSPPLPARLARGTARAWLHLEQAHLCETSDRIHTAAAGFDNARAHTFTENPPRERPVRGDPPHVATALLAPLSIPIRHPQRADGTAARVISDWPELVTRVVSPSWTPPTQRTPHHSVTAAACAVRS